MDTPTSRFRLVSPHRSHKPMFPTLSAATEAAEFQSFAFKVTIMVEEWKVALAEDPISKGWVQVLTVTRP